ncbi:MAG: hypothetical protein EON88_01410 [Brevundimonas sp.]|nr:MAG: hypothetical protein EON88_01410 [Brevundimonas sp.]
MLEGLKRQGWPLSLLLASALGGVAGWVTGDPFDRVETSAVTLADEGLPSFADEAQFREFLRARRAVVVAQQRRMRARYADEAVSAMIVEPTDAAAASDSITNVQEAGVDEGGIVKASGDHLIVLRRGRLFTFFVGGGSLRAVDRIDVTPPGAAPPEQGTWDGVWYDEMLVVGGYVVVIGYSYEKEGTEVVRFRLGADGTLAFHDASRLTASDYYSAENYASRLVGDELVLYNTRQIGEPTRPDRLLPALTDETPGRPRRTRVLARAEDVFIDPNAGAANLAYDSLHSVTRCDLTAARLNCSATAVIGPASRTFYVSPRAIYLWTTAWSGEGGRAPATVYRLPLAGGRPQAVRVSGAPLDQFSFREDPERGRLDVVVQSDYGGDAMWSRTLREGSVALLSLPLDQFGDGSDAAARVDYRELRGPATIGWRRENRFVGPWLLYAVGDDGDYGAETGGTLLATRVDRDVTRTFRLPSAVSRIEVMGDDALVVSAGPRGLTMTAVELDANARLGAMYAVPGAGESEGRSHGFFFRPDAPGAATGMFGLPIQKFPPPDSRHAPGAGGLKMLFVRREVSGFEPLGALATAGTDGNDHCRSSCTDWYGQSRPIFLRGRVFALMGYELAEGRVESGRIREIARVDFTPRRS